jgi:hypothetical protein
MPSQHTTEEETNQAQGMVVPLELDGLCILRRVWTVTWFTRMEPSSWQSPLSAPWPFLTLFLRSASDVADRASFQELV